MNTYEQMFPDLTLFSDLNWEIVKEEYEANYSDMSFPEYLQQKSIEGDCPPYLYELAYFELALFELQKIKVIPKSEDRGIHLNPTACFLNLEFDIKEMKENASKGDILILERPNILCLFLSQLTHEMTIIEVNQEELVLLSQFEEAKEHFQFENDRQKSLVSHFIKTGLLSELI